MSTREKLNQALVLALKEGDSTAKTTIRMALSAVQEAEIESRRALEEEQLIAILQKEVKSRREAIAEAATAGRPELAAQAESEIEVLEAFLPKPLSKEELRRMVAAAIEETGASSMHEMGAVMKTLMPRVKGRADGKVLSELVRSALQG